MIELANGDGLSISSKAAHSHRQEGTSSSTNVFPGNHRTLTNVSDGFLLQREMIVQCARKLYETKGATKTTLADIAREAEMTRELIYYYFDNKAEITSCVYESYMQDAIETVLLWREEWEWATWNEGDTLVRAVADAVASARRFMYKRDGTRSPEFSVMQQGAQEYAAEDYVYTRLADELVPSILGDCLRANHPELSERQVRDVFRFLLAGIVHYLSGKNNASDASLVDVLVMLLNS